MKTYGEVDVNSALNLGSHVHAPAILFPRRKSAWYALIGLLDPRTGLDAVGKGMIYSPTGNRSPIPRSSSL
jgi:hypothetical protein